MITATAAPALVYKIVDRAAAPSFEQGGGVFLGMPIDHADGYIHLSTAMQLADTLSLHFRGQRDLLILAVRTADIAPALRWEPSRGGQLFPHLYGPLPLSAVVWQEQVSVGPNGEVELPPRIA
jgi:uncharacterized protein (DUF952 family)